MGLRFFEKHVLLTCFNGKQRKVMQISFLIVKEYGKLEISSI